MKNKKAIYNFIFILIFMAMISVPALLMDHEKYKSSDIDNKTLTEWPGFSFDSETISTIEDYVDDRIGFRSAAIYEYTKLSNDIFKYMFHSLYVRHGLKGAPDMLPPAPLPSSYVRFRIRSHAPQCAPRR